jgi:hypothetical protein
MLKLLRLRHLKIDIFVAKVSRDLYKVMVVAAYFAILLGLFGSFLLILNPSIDDEITTAIVNSLISKYDSLDSIQKNKIQIIFSEIFIEQ